MSKNSVSLSSLQAGGVDSDPSGCANERLCRLVFKIAPAICGRLSGLKGEPLVGNFFVMFAFADDYLGRALRCYSLIPPHGQDVRMTAILTLGVPLWATAIPTHDGSRYRREFQDDKTSFGMLQPLGTVVGAHLKRNPSHSKANIERTVAIADLAGHSDVVLEIDDQTWKDYGFWPTSKWYPAT